MAKMVNFVMCFFFNTTIKKKSLRKVREGGRGEGSTHIWKMLGSIVIEVARSST